MKIVHYHPEMILETGGVVRAVLDLCTGLANAGLDVTLLTSNSQDLPDAWLQSAPGTPKVRLIDPPTGPGGLYTRAGKAAIAEGLVEADVLHLHGMWTPSNLQFASLARRRGLPYFYSVHGMLDDWCMEQRALKKRFYLGLAGRRMLQGAEAVLCTAQAELDQAKRWFPKGHGEVLPLSMDLELFESLPGPTLAQAKLGAQLGDEPTVLFLSRLHEKKGLESLIHATRLLAEHGVPARVLIAGTDMEQGAYTRRLQTLCEELSLTDRIHFVGFISGVEKISLYQAADLFVLPTHQENFGFVLFEAMAAGTPVITTRGADTWPELQDSGGAVIVDSEPETIAATIRELLDDEPRRIEMGRRGRAWVFENLTEERIIEQYRKRYAASLDSKAPHGP